MKVAILIAIGIGLWLGGYAIKGVYVSEEIGKGISGIGFFVILFVAWWIIKNWYHKP